ncbi:MAG: FliH/SctL family protein [Candidatus Algichlamydia australiensis]|nr:FliH/SctL family protein [Chlamydiales bacterium]
MKLFSLIEDGEIHLEEGKKILTQEEFATLLDAKGVLDKAKKDAETYMKGVKTRAAKLRVSAKEEGFAEGLNRINAQIVALDQKVKEIEHEMQKKILPLALKAAKKIFGRELNLSSEAIVDIVLQTLKPVKESHKIKILVNKEDLKTLEKEKAKLREMLEYVEILTLEERSDLEKGDCIIETEGGIINATLENQWRALESAFKTYLEPKK